jgi:hypothetical protein
MLMERAAQFRRLRAPQGDGQTLIDPGWSTLPDVVGQNRAILRGVEYELHGKSLCKLSSTARRHLLQFAVAYTSQYRDVPAHWQNLEVTCATPFILSGHQPEMFHPGVWYKNFVLGGLARQMDGVGIHLLIDSDLCRAASIRVPTGTVQNPHLEIVPYDKPSEEMPYEERSIRDAATFQTFAERVSTTIQPLIADPMIRELWPLSLKRNALQTNLGLRLAQGRHAFEATWNNETLELPQSAVCQLPEFAWFVVHLLANLPRFRTAHNEALALYRRAHHLRNRAQPVPDLAATGEWLEAPFWIWTTQDPERRPLFARRVGGEIELTDRKTHTIRIPLTQDGDAAAAAEQLAALAAGGIKLRTRALATTLFARLVLSDLFLHGIGGAKYDQVTDQIIRLFFEIEPPVFATVSATLRLPIPHQTHDAAAAGQWNQRLRELQYHPEHFVDAATANDNGDDGRIREIIASKRRWLATDQTPVNARERHLAITSANEALQPFVATLRTRVEHERDDINNRKRGEAILNSREYSFGLYPKQHFEKLLADPPLIS